MDLGAEWSKLWTGAKDAAQQALSDISKTAVPALEASAEEWGIKVLKEQTAALEAGKKESQERLAAGIKEVSERDSAPGSFGAILSGEISAASLKVYAPWILGGVAVILVAGMLLKGKG